MKNYFIIVFLFSCLGHGFGQNQTPNNNGNIMNQMPMNNGIKNQMPMNNGNMNQMPMNNGNMNQMPMNNGNMNKMPMNNGNMNQMPMNNGNMNQMPMNNGNMNQMPMNNGNMNQIPMNGNNMNQSQGQQNNGTSGTTNMMNLNVGNPDQGNITRPCQPYDTHCIRRFFAEHSHCKKAYGPVPEPLYRKRNILYLPRINVTSTLYDVRLTGLNGRIEEFYINRDTDKLVIAIDFRGLSLASNRSYGRFHRRSKEPIVIKSSANVTYGSLIVTAIIPQIYNLRLDKAVVFGYLNDPSPNYMLGPEVLNSTDPQVMATLAAFAMNPRANVGEMLLTDAPFYPPTFIQYNLCDFGLKIL